MRGKIMTVSRPAGDGLELAKAMTDREWKPRRHKGRGFSFRRVFASLRSDSLAVARQFIFCI